jgi:hypothetical protein
MMAITTSDPKPVVRYNTMAAATLPQFNIPTIAATQDTGKIDLSEDLIRELAREKGVLDTVCITKTDTIKEQVTKVKWKRAPAPDPIVIRDTIRETYYYLATQTGMKEGPGGECIPIYEVHKVDEICPETNNSSVKLSNELDNDVGE